MLKRMVALTVFSLTCCAASRTSTVPAELNVTALDDDTVPITWERDRRPTAPSFVRFKLMTTPTCEVRVKISPVTIEWRELPASIDEGIRSGSISDDLAGLPDEHGIIDCFSVGCWRTMHVDTSGCGSICSSAQRVCLP